MIKSRLSALVLVLLATVGCVPSGSAPSAAGAGSSAVAATTPGQPNQND